MKHQIVQIKAWARPVYTCRSCGVQQTGSTAEVTVVSVSALQQALGTTAEARHMPVGWASYGGTFTCDRCTP